MTRPIRIARRDAGKPPADLVSAFGPVLARIYNNRGLATPQEAHNALAGLAPYASLKGIEAAAELLADAVEAQARIVIVGDFDADGATGCAVAMRGLRAMGANEVSYLVPDRFRFGYGLSPPIVEVAAEREPDVLITVDNGIASIDGVAAAREHGMSVVVTDHHLPGHVLPAADAIVNPNQPGCTFPSKNVAGVGVMFYLLAALRARLRETGWFEAAAIEAPNLGTLLDLVAVGTVADVVPLDRNNRILVAQGLARIRSGHCAPGIWALLAQARRDPTTVTATDIAFGVGPRLNAAGRLDDMSVGIECLLSDDRDQATALAAQLGALNDERRGIEDDMRVSAMQALERMTEDDPAALPYGLCMRNVDWHPGVVGILASRIKDRYHRPVIAFASDGEGGLKGSARSIPGLHVRDALDAVATANPGLVTRFGGHAMAAGLTLPEASYDAFASAFDAAVRERLEPHQLEGVIDSDGPLDALDIGLETARQLRDGGPWGQGFGEPVFDGEFTLRSARCVGERHWKLSVEAVGGGTPVVAMAFSRPEFEPPANGSSLHFAYRLDVNVYNGLETPQLTIEHITGYD